MIQLVKPAYEELLFRQQLLADAETMSYNKKWGGVIHFPPDRWRDWYEKWVVCPDRRYYRYLYSTEHRAFVGETAFYFDDEFQCHICDIIVKHCCRGQGFGKEGLLLLLNEAKKQGITVIRDNIAIGNPSIALFQRCGFTEAWRTEDFVMMEKQL